MVKRKGSQRIHTLNVNGQTKGKYENHRQRRDAFISPAEVSVCRHKGQTLKLYVEYESVIHAMPTDSLLSLSGRTGTCRWIWLHSSVGFNHMICFCFLSSHRHGNPVYGCPQQQVKHRTPKQKGEFPALNKSILPRQLQHTGKTACPEKCWREIAHAHNGLQQIPSVNTHTHTQLYTVIYYCQCLSMVIEWVIKH